VQLSLTAVRVVGACRWLANREKWMYGSFSELDAEGVEKDVDAYASAIAKANKFFEREMKENQAGTCIAAHLKPHQKKSSACWIHTDLGYSFFTTRSNCG
jgi:predicted helicase